MNAGRQAGGSGQVVGGFRVRGGTGGSSLLGGGGTSNLGSTGDPGQPYGGSAPA